MKFRTPSRAASTLSLAMVLLVATTLLGQQLTPARSSKIAQMVCQMIEANHISQHAVDDSVSEKLVLQFVKDLDVQKMYFLQSDIDQLNQSRDRLDDELKAGNLDFAINTFNLYLKRLDERIAEAQKLIDAPHDFTIEESMSIDSKGTLWAKTSAELDERWRKRIKYDLLLLKLNDDSDKDSRKKAEKDEEGKPEIRRSPEKEKLAEKLDPRQRLHKRYKNIQQTMHKTDTDEVIEMYLTALCTTFDPHSSYMSPRTLEDFRIQMELSLEGIGAALRSEDGYTIVAQIVPGGAAATDGRLKPGDKIIGVGNEGGEIHDVVEMKLTKVVDQIRGKRGTKVRLQVIAATSGETKVYELTRQKVELKSAEVKGEIIKTGDRLKGTEARIGVVHIPSFYRDFKGAENGEDNFKSTARDMKKVLQSFVEAGGVDAVIIDLRTNGGGALMEAIEVSGAFIYDGPVVQVKNQKGRVKELLDEESGTDYSGPLVVLTNRLSASASEIFAGVIKDYNRGLIVGDRTTHGKGTVQSVMNVGRRFFDILNPPDQGALKLTIQQFYRVNGDSTQNLGVPSDISLPSLIDNMDLGESFLDNAMAFDRVPEAPHQRLAMVSPELVSALRERSRRRVSQNTDFQKVEKEIGLFLARKQRKNVPLNEVELRKERIEDEQKVTENLDSNGDMADAPIFPDNDYNNEVLSITVDYLNQLRDMKTAKK